MKNTYLVIYHQLLEEVGLVNGDILELRVLKYKEISRSYQI